LGQIPERRGIKRGRSNKRTWWAGVGVGGHIGNSNCPSRKELRVSELRRLVFSVKLFEYILPLHLFSKKGTLQNCLLWLGFSKYRGSSCIFCRGYSGAELKMEHIGWWQTTNQGCGHLSPA
jgi:hypothetical protein